MTDEKNELKVSALSRYIEGLKSLRLRVIALYYIAPRHFGTVVEGPFNGSQIFTMLSLGKILHFLTDSTKFLFARLTFI